MAELPHIDISPQDWAIFRDILRRYVPDREVRAAGSRAKWTARKFSDLDLVVMGNEGIGIYRTAELREAFQESALPFKVDIVHWAAADEFSRKIIEQCAVVLQEGQPAS